TATRLSRWPGGSRSTSGRPFTSQHFGPRCGRFFEQASRSRAQGLTPQRHLLLLMIKGAPDGSEQATVMELADRMHFAQSTVTELVRRGEEVGLVERERSGAYGRVAHLRLTAEGERRLARVFEAHANERARLREVLAELEAIEHE